MSGFSSGRNQTCISPEDFGPTGTANDYATLLAFYSALNNSGKTGYIKGQYVTQSCHAVPLNNCRLVGVPGYSRVTRAGGYDALNLTGGVSNLEIDGVWYATSYDTDTYYDAGVVWTAANTSIQNLRIKNHKITAPDANCRGLMIYANTGEGATTFVDGLWIEDGEFSNIGNTACTVMNRGPASYLKNFHLDRNKGVNLGLIQDGNAAHEHGMLFSLDGSGTGGTMDDNDLDNCYEIGLEIAGAGTGPGFSGLKVRDNNFRGFSRSWHPFGMSGGTAHTDLRLSGNETLEAGSEDSYFTNVNDSIFEGQRLINAKTSGGGATHAAARFANASRNLSRDNFYKGAGASVVIVGYAGTCADNRFVDDSLETPVTSASGIECSGLGSATVTGNKGKDLRLRLGSGGSALTENNGASGNSATSY